jgi:hypothetical protein
LATLKPPLSSSPFFIYSNPREVPSRR